MTQNMDFIAKHILATTPTFGASVRTLGAPLSDWISTAYLIARTYDAVEDCSSVDWKIRYEILSKAKFLVWDKHKRKLWLPQLQLIIDGAGTSIHKGEIGLLKENEQFWSYVDALPDKVLRIIEPHLNFLSDGMAEFARNEKKIGISGFPTMGALMNYCYSVAGVVGSLLTDIFVDSLFDNTQNDNYLFLQAQSLAPSFGFAKQLSNILKNIGDDIKRGICFIPRDLLFQEDLTAEFLVANPEHPKSQRLVIKYISFIMPNVLRAIEYTKIFKNFSGESRNQLAFNIRRALAAQIILIIKTIRRAIENPSHAFYERKLQLQKDDMDEIIREVIRITPSCDETDHYLKSQFNNLNELIVKAQLN
jgi:farnesyl-diphosphate farnesyltransferase